MKVKNIIEETLICLNKEELLAKFALLNAAEGASSNTGTDGELGIGGLPNPNTNPGFGTGTTLTGQTNLSLYFSEDEVKELNILVRCFNLVYAEVCIYCLPLIKEEKVIFKGGKFNFADLTKNIIEVQSVKNLAGNKMPYRQNFDYIYCKAFDTAGGALVAFDSTQSVAFGNAVSALLTYSYYPEVLAFDDEVVVPTNKLTMHALAFGVAREHCIIADELDGADLWDARFQESVKNAMRKSKSVSIKARRWE